MEIIIPCGGLSTRYPNLRPKYLLTAYDGKMMIEKAVDSIRDNIRDCHISITILKEHNEQYNAVEKIRRAIKDVSIFILEHRTSGPAETVYNTLKTGLIDVESKLLIKDCDSFYDFTDINGNAVYTSNLTNKTTNVCGKSYVIKNDQNIINSIVEKQVVSDTFCCGGYQFESGNKYINYYEKAKHTEKELFISDVIQYMISNGEIFNINNVSGYIDVGTLEEWLDYNDKPTIFCDIDGVLVKAKFDEYSVYEPIQENIDALLEKVVSGCKLIFCSARPEHIRDLTEDMLNEIGFSNYTLILGVNHAKRIVINDYYISNPYPTAVAINLKRDDTNLSEYLKA